jgi:hypothetical protein
LGLPVRGSGEPKGRRRLISCCPEESNSVIFCQARRFAFSAPFVSP